MLANALRTLPSLTVGLLTRDFATMSEARASARADFQISVLES
jgi:hypothetical protein